MSLETLNYPPLVAALSLGSYGLLPSAKNVLLPWTTLKVVHLAVYGFSLMSVSRPGRYDGQDPKDTTGEGADSMAKMSTGKRGRSLVTPSGWAFIIWAPIFLGEGIMVASLLALQESSPLAPLIQQITGPYVVAQLFQSLWAASFRPKYKGLYKVISAMNLSGIAYSLSFCHGVFTKTANTKSYSTAQYLLFLLPLSLHFGWTTAAAVVNINGMVAMGDNVSSRTVAWVGHASVVGAAALGAWITTTRSAPVYGGVIAWALSAVASGMKTRIHETSKEDPDRVGVYGATTQRNLALVGAAISASASLYTAVSLIKK